MAGARILRAVAAACGILAALLVVALGVTAVLFPGEQSAAPLILQPDSGWPLPILALVAATALAASVRAQRPHPSAQRVSFIVAAWCAASAVVLGVAATVRCPIGGDRFFATLWQTMVLFVGTSPEAFDGGRCEGPVPLAAQWARTAAMVAVFATAVALAVHAATRSLRRHRFRRRPVREVVVGLDAGSVPLVGALLRRTASDESVVAVVLSKTDAAATEVAADLGADVFELGQVPIPRLDADPWRSGNPAVLAEALEPFLVTRGRITARHLWVTSDSSDVADQVCAAVTELSGADPPLHDISVMTRCVSATHARRERARMLPRLVPDASPSATHLLLCPVSDEEVGAMELVGRVLSQPPGTIVLIGAGAFAAAVMHELALRWWEAGIRSQAGEPDLPNDATDLLTGGWRPHDVILVADQASRILDHWRRAAGPLRAAGDSWQTWDCRSDQFEPDNLPSNGRVHCVLMHRLDPALLELLLVDERMTVWEPRDSEAEARALRRGDRHDHGYTCDLLMSGWPPEDPWTRVARHTHEVMRRLGSATDARPWWHSEPDRRLPTGAREQALTALRDLMVSQQGSDGRWEYQPLRAHPGGGRSYREIVAATLAAQGYVLTRDGAIGER